MSDNNQSAKSTQEYVVDFIKSLAAVEAEMLPYQEHRKDLRKSYVQNGWLSKEELAAATRAYRMLKNSEDIDQLQVMYDKLAKVDF